MTLSRREFLTSASAAATAALLPAAGIGRARSFTPRAERVIFINLIGGPSQLDTWDPKPEAPSEIRGPFRPIATKVPGIQFAELFPQMAGIADKLAIVRSVHHDSPPIHEAGLQIVNTGQFYRDAEPIPNLGAVICQATGRPWFILGAKSVDCGIRCDSGFSAGALPGGPHTLAADHDPLANLDILTIERSSCVTVNLYPTVFDQPSWDCHAAGGALLCDLNDYRSTVAPRFDRSFARLIRNLERSGLLSSTLVVATGEFGRTPRINGNGGRDHWAGCWTAIFAGGGVQGGRVIGRSDLRGAEPADRPVHAREIPATVLAAMGLPAASWPIAELF